jgi:hypothetical protein
MKNVVIMGAGIVHFEYVCRRAQGYECDTSMLNESDRYAWRTFCSQCVFH